MQCIVPRVTSSISERLIVPSMNPSMMASTMPGRSRRGGICRIRLRRGCPIHSGLGGGTSSCWLVRRIRTTSLVVTSMDASVVTCMMPSRSRSGAICGIRLRRNCPVYGGLGGGTTSGWLVRRVRTTTVAGTVGVVTTRDLVGSTDTSTMRSRIAGGRSFTVSMPVSSAALRCE